MDVEVDHRNKEQLSLRQRDTDTPVVSGYLGVASSNIPRCMVPKMSTPSRYPVSRYHVVVSLDGGMQRT